LAAKGLLGTQALNALYGVTSGLTIADVLSGAKTAKDLYDLAKNLGGGGNSLGQQGLSLLGGGGGGGGGVYPQSLQSTGLTSQAPSGQLDLMQKLTQLYPQMSNVSPQTMAAIAPPRMQNVQESNLPAEEPQYFAKGGLSHHRPEFITGATGHYIKGRGDGQSDDIPAMLADGEYVFDADTVAALGNGSSDAGAKRLDEMREAIRKHKRSAPIHKIPPKAKSPLEYLKG
jgi:hypothetical protein